MNSWILDTGPIVAYLNGRDPYHEAVCTCLDRFHGELVTSSAVITEAMHFVSRNPEGPRLLSELVLATGLTTFDLSQPSDLQSTVELMEKYLDLPMDYADATLVLLAERLSVFEF